MDLALPKARGNRLRPAIIVIHGGGWREGDKSSFSTVKDRVPGNIIDFAEHGFVAATINYRLSLEAPYPAALEDCRAALRWLRQQAGEYQIDPDRIGAYGNSAGAHLALLLGLSDPDDKEGIGVPSSRVQAVVSDSGPLDLLLQHRNNQLRSVIETFLGGPPDDVRTPTYRLASPSNYLPKKIPPLLLIYGEADEQVDVITADLFVSRLSQSGHKDVSYFRLSGIGHCPHSIAQASPSQTRGDRVLRTNTCPIPGSSTPFEGSLKRRY